MSTIGHWKKRLCCANWKRRRPVTPAACRFRRRVFLPELPRAVAALLPRLRQARAQWWESASLRHAAGTRGTEAAVEYGARTAVAAGRRSTCPACATPSVAMLLHRRHRPPMSTTAATARHACRTDARHSFHHLARCGVMASLPQPLPRPLPATIGHRQTHHRAVVATATEDDAVVAPPARQCRRRRARARRVTWPNGGTPPAG